MSAIEFIFGIRLRLRVSHSLSLLLGALLFSIPAHAQVSSTGTAASKNFGSQAVGSSTAAKSLSFSVVSGTKVGSIAVLTTGVANLDFANAAGSTCTAVTYSAATNCVVDVTFTPQAAGLRMGAVVFFSKANNTGTVLGSALVYGIGLGAQIAYGPGTMTEIDRTMNGKVGLANPGGMAADAAGNLFVADSDGDNAIYRVVKVPQNGAATTTIQPAVNGQGLYLPSSVAVDGAGNLYIGDFLNRVLVVPIGGGTATAIAPKVNGLALSYPSGLALDGAGDLFIGDFLNNRVIEVPAGGGAATAIRPTVNGITLNDPRGVAVDAAGDLFIADLGNGRVVEVPAGGGAASAIDPVVNGEGLWNPDGVAVDSAGDLFIADNVNHRVVKVPAGGGASTAIDPSKYLGGVGEVYSVAVDAAGDLFFTQAGLQGGNNIVEEFQYGTNTSFNFPTPTEVGSSDSVDGPTTVEIVNVGNLALTLTALSFPADFSKAGGGSSACTASSTLNPGQACNVSIEFTPVNTGVLSESVSLTDNALDGAGARQTISVTGTGERQGAITSPAPGGVLPGSSATFTWTAGTSATAYYLSIGSTGVGSSNVFQSGKRTGTSWMASGLPTNGEPIYVRLTTYFGSIQMYADYLYTACSPASLITPASGAVLPGPTVTFTWAASAGATSYALTLGSKGAGSSDVYNSGNRAVTSWQATGVPTNGETIYVRLTTNFNSGSAYVDSTYTAAKQGVLTSPAPGSLLAGASVTFAWAAGAQATGYALWLGSTGVGSQNLYASTEMAGTSVAVTKLPTTGVKIYARLITYFNGAQSYTDYTYTAK